MSLFNKIKTALTSLDIPIKRLGLSKEESKKNYEQYIIVTEYNQQGQMYADNKEVVTAHYIQISLFTRLNYVETVKQIKSLLSEIGFTRTSEFESYEDQTSYYHKVIRFSYSEEN